MPKFDREEFNLLKMTDSGSESVPDLKFDLPSDNRQKKKVRLKRYKQIRHQQFINNIVDTNVNQPQNGLMTNFSSYRELKHNLP